MKNPILKFLIVLTSVVLSGTQTFAQQRPEELQRGAGGHGGDAVKTRSGYRFLDLVRENDEIIDLDGKGYLNGLRAQLGKQPGFSIATYFPAEHGTRTRPIGEKILSALESLTFYRVNGPLPEINDRDVVVLPWSFRGRVVRLAFQESNTLKVVVDKTIFDALPRKDKLAFFMHEALIRVYLDDFYNNRSFTTVKIAAAVKATFEQSNLSARLVARYMCDAGITTDQYSNFNLTQLSGWMGKSPSFPKETLAFAKADGQCATLALTLNGDPTPKSNYNVVPPATAIHQWRFTAREVSGPTYSAWLSKVEKRDGYETWFESRAGIGSPFSLLAGNYLNIVRQYRFGFWTP